MAAIPDVRAMARPGYRKKEQLSSIVEQVARRTALGLNALF